MKHDTTRRRGNVKAFGQTSHKSSKFTISSPASIQQKEDQPMNDELATIRPPEIVDPSRPWLLREVDPVGKETFSVRVFFWAMRGPNYFGPFVSEA